MNIVILKQATPSTLRDINQLIATLREDKGKTAGTLPQLRSIVSDKNTAVVVAIDGKRIIGIATLYIVRKFGTITGDIEDVIINEAYRGQGLGEKIMKKLIAVVRAKKMNSVRLTSRPSRIAANKLYQKLGFKKRETNAYKLVL